MSDGLDFYDLLGVDPDATQEQVQRAFRRRIREYHPDRNDDPRAPAQFIALKQAYDTLGDPKERDAYDRLGHEAYVSERIGGLPSVDTWATTETADADDVTASGRDGAWTVDSDDAGHADAESAADFADYADFDVTTDGRDAATGDAASDTIGPDRSTDGVVVDAGDAAARGGGRRATGVVRSPGVSKSPTASGAGTARGPKTTPAPETDSTPDDETDAPPDPDPAVSAATDSRNSSFAERLHERARWLFGWPMVAVADLVYLAALVAVSVANADGVARLAAAVDAGGPSAAFDGSYGITGPAALIGGALAGDPLVGGTVLLGVSLLPSVYVPLVLWTRRHSQWNPSYLYAVGAVVPVAWTVASAAGVDGGLAAGLVAYVVVPLVTMGAMVSVRILLPRGIRLLRRYRYRLFG